MSESNKKITLKSSKVITTPPPSITQSDPSAKPEELQPQVFDIEEYKANDPIRQSLYNKILHEEEDDFFNYLMEELIRYDEAILKRLAGNSAPSKSM